MGNTLRETLLDAIASGRLIPLWDLGHITSLRTEEEVLTEYSGDHSLVALEDSYVRVGDILKEE
jgi:hypothetical protein